MPVQVAPILALAGCVGLALAAPVQHALAQTVVTAPDLCRDCLRTLSPTDRVLSTVAPGDVALDSRGRYWVVQTDVAKVEVFGLSKDDSGVVGARGQGPREFMGPSALIPQGDSMWVADAANRRLTLVGPDLSIARSVGFEGGIFDGLAVSDSVLLVNAIVLSQKGTGQALHLVDTRSGQVLESFGNPDGNAASNVRASTLIASLAEGPRGTVFVAFRARPLVQEWSTEGELLREWLVDAPWLRPGRSAGMGTPSVAPDPVTTLVLPIGDETIGLGVWTVRDDWEAAWAGIPPETMEIAESESPAPDALWRGAWVEVDLRTSEVTLATGLPFLPRRTAGTAVLQFEDTFDPQLRIWTRSNQRD